VKSVTSDKWKTNFQLNLCFCFVYGIIKKMIINRYRRISKLVATASFIFAIISFLFILFPSLYARLGFSYERVWWMERLGVWSLIILLPILGTLIVISIICKGKFIDEHFVKVTFIVIISFPIMFLLWEVSLNLLPKERPIKAAAEVNLRDFYITMQTYHSNHGTYPTRSKKPTGRDDFLSPFFRDIKPLPYPWIGSYSYFWIDNTSNAQKFCAGIKIDDLYIIASHLGIKKVIGGISTPTTLEECEHIY
jgi:hypothetical protein